MRRTVVGGCWLVLACGEIREVMVPAGGSTTSGNGTSSTVAESSGDADTEDQDGAPTTVGSSGGTTSGAAEPMRELFCGQAFAIGSELEDDENSLVVDDVATILDLDVSLRLSHESIAALEITLVREGATVVLLEPRTVSCAGQLDGMFDDEAEAADGGCGVVDDAGVLRLVPSQTLSSFDGDSIAGQWWLSIGPADAAVGDVTGWCLVAQLESQD